VQKEVNTTVNIRTYSVWI